MHKGDKGEGGAMYAPGVETTTGCTCGEEEEEEEKKEGPA